MIALPRLKHSGFTLVEVMVALVVISVGMLGIAKMQALALSSTGSAKTRSLAALQAASLAATMQADRAYWSAIALSNFTITVPASGTFTSSTTDSALVAPTNACVSTSTTINECSAAQLAAEDLTEWANSLHSVLQGSSATIECTKASTSTPSNCRITIVWSDHVVSLNTSSNTASATADVNSALSNFAQQTSKYRLFVEP
jgi:type IV pilus assembly protein PilV